MKFSLVSLRTGTIYFYNSPDSLLHDSYSLLTAHKCPISMLTVNRLQKKFYSLGSEDKALIEWSVKESRTCKDVFVPEREMRTVVEDFDTVEHFATN